MQLYACVCWCVCECALDALGAIHLLLLPFLLGLCRRAALCHCLLLLAACVGVSSSFWGLCFCNCTNCADCDNDDDDNGDGDDGESDALTLIGIGFFRAKNGNSGQTLEKKFSTLLSVWSATLKCTATSAVTATATLAATATTIAGGDGSGVNFSCDSKFKIIMQEIGRKTNSKNSSENTKN